MFPIWLAHIVSDGLVGEKPPTSLQDSKVGTIFQQAFSIVKVGTLVGISWIHQTNGIVTGFHGRHSGPKKTPPWFFDTDQSQEVVKKKTVSVVSFESLFFLSLLVDLKLGGGFKYVLFSPQICQTLIPRKSNRFRYWKTAIFERTPLFGQTLNVRLC